MSPDTHVDERPLRERFAALQHPPEAPDWAKVVLLTGPTRQRRAPSRRRPLLALAAALVLAGAAGAATIVLLGGDAREDTAPPASAMGEPLAPLPEGPPSSESMGQQLIEAVTLDELIAEAPVVFIGVVEAVGGSERVAGLGGMTTHRVRYLIERPLRGVGEGLIDITELDTEFDGIDLSADLTYEPGERYLVFAEPRRLGTSESPVLVPYGSIQGVFRLTGEDTAENDWLGEIRLSELEARLAGR